VRSKQIKPTLMLALWLLLCAAGFAQDSLTIPPAEYAERRVALSALMADNSVAVFHAAEAKTRSNDINYEYRQSSNMLYLTGIVEPGTALILAKPAHASGRTTAILFMPETNPRRGRYQGSGPSARHAATLSGIDSVQSYGTFSESLARVLRGKKILYYDFPVDFIYEPVSGQRFFVSRQAKKKLKPAFSGLRVKSPGKMLTALRQIKSTRELAIMQKAIDITTAAHLRAMQHIRPGVHEYEVEAHVEYVFKSEGAEYPAFPSIVGSGPNSVILHHWKNRRKVEAGDVVVIDIGAEVAGYSADVTRTIPVSGRFSPAQREIYEIVLRAQQQAMAVIKPGLPFRQVHAAAKKVIAGSGFGKYFTHGTSHYLGLDTHDVGDRKALQPGMVITVEPGIYIPEGAEVDEKYWHIGIRIEDDVLVTDDGFKILSNGAPRTIAEIEKLMQAGAASAN